MKLFTCDGCGQLVYFENTLCVACGRALAYEPSRRDMVALETREGRLQRTDGSGEATFCANAAHGVCNWLLDEGDPGPFCRCCRHNRTIPDLSAPGNLELWGRIEGAKHRLFDALLALGLPLATRAEDPEGGLAFDFIDTELTGGGTGTGHASGVVTIAIHEADHARREQIREELGEPYRSLLGHLRHEIAHYFFDRLVAPDPAATEAFRELFGDERADYATALQRHYDEGAPADWQQAHVSAYATAHPWEDFAETFAHYLHIVDTLETAHAFGISVRPRVNGGDMVSARADLDPVRVGTIEALIDRWLPLTYAVNSLSRSMGQPDLYPFVLAPRVIDKLGFVHGLVRGAAASPAT